MINNHALSGMLYRYININTGWSDGGAGDFFSSGSAEWEMLGDINAPGSFIGRYRLNLSPTNTNAPWTYNWIENKDLVFRVAVRSGPNSIPAIQIRPDRETLGAGIVFQINTTPGIQIFEVDIPASLKPNALIVGGSISLPSGYIEENGQLLQILGAYVGIKGDPNGLVIGYQGRGGWNLLDHLTLISQESRVRLIEMLHLNHMILMQGHNRDWGDKSNFPTRLVQLINLWDSAFDTAGYSRPNWILVEPWRIQDGDWDGYATIVENGMAMVAKENPKAVHVRFGSLFNNLRPDQFDPIRYQLDFGWTHPGNVPTAGALMEDMESLIFRKE